MLVQREAMRISILKQTGKVSNEQSPGAVVVYSICAGAVWLITPKAIPLTSASEAFTLLLDGLFANSQT